MENPFVPGARVAVRSRYGNGITESFVDKVYKNGNFTLRGSTQQWKPSSSHWSERVRWSAIQTGSAWFRDALEFWDEAADAEIQSEIAAAQLKRRWAKLQEKIRCIQSPTSEMCDQIEAALEGVKS